VQRPSSGGGASQYGGSGLGQSSGTRPSFDAGQSRQQTQTYSNRGASSRASMGGGGGGYSGGSRGGGGGSRGGGGGGRR